MEAIIGYVFGFFVVAVFSSVGFHIFVEEHAKNKQKEKNPDVLTQLGYLIIIVCMLVLFLISTFFAGNHFGHWWIGVLPYLMYPFMIGYIGLFKAGVRSVHGLEQAAIRFWELLRKQQGIDSIIKRMKKRVSGSPAWEGAITSVEALATELPVLAREILDVSKRKASVERTMIQLGINIGSDDLGEAQAIVDSHIELAQRKERLEKLVQDIKFKIGAAQAMSELSNSDEHASEVIRDVATLMNSVENEMSVAAKTEHELSASQIDKKHHGAREASKRTA